VREDLPTLEEALFAAEGLTSDPAQQIAIAAELMKMPEQDVWALAKATQTPQTRSRKVIATGRVGGVIVEKKPARRVLPIKRSG
jgi:hypothetical protein